MINHRLTQAPLAVHLVTVSLLASAAIHLALVPEHLREEPVLGVLFLLASAAALGLPLAAYAGVPGWRPAAGLLLTILIAGYVLTRLSGYEEWDAVGLATKVVELLGLAAVVISARGARTWAAAAR